MRIIECEQGSEEWLDLRKGRITMSHAKDLLAGGQGKTRESYLMKCAAERLADFPDNPYYSNDMLRGNELEPFARMAFESLHGEVRQVGFVLHDDERIGCSPDGLTETAGLEIKCPRPETHLKYLSREYVEREHGPQMQGCMWICGRASWWFVSFCPWVHEMPIIVHEISRDDAVIAKLENSAIRGADEIGAMLYDIVTCRANTPAVYQLAKEAKEYWNNLTSTSDEGFINE